MSAPKEIGAEQHLHARQMQIGHVDRNIAIESVPDAEGGELVSAERGAAAADAPPGTGFVAL